MKITQIILIFCLINYYYTEDLDECATEFESILKNKCESIDSKCVYDTNFIPSCIRFGRCDDSEALYDRDICHHTITVNIYSGKRCGFYGDCREDTRYCSDHKWPGVYSVTMKEDNCLGLMKGTVNDGKYSCYYRADGSCQSILEECSKQTDSEYCGKNVPKNSRTKKCIWNEDSSSCIETDRYCNDSLWYLFDKEQCSELKTSDTAKKCIYKKEDVSICKEVYPICEQYSQSTCNGQTPLDLYGTDYEHLYKCQYDTSKGKCMKVRRNCNDFNATLGDDENMCLQLMATDSIHKQCVFINGKCEERYKKCDYYNNNELIKTKESCEEMIFPEETEKCVFNIKDNICESRKEYSDCEEYKGSDELICQSIISSKNNKNCVLQKKENDYICRERYFPCSEALTKDECYVYARPVEKNKKCVFDEINNKCLEQYKKCEDYKGNDSNECEKINIYNGQKCIFESNICISKNKTCSEALNEDECEIIKNIGVSEENKICDFINNTCQENYKYCSDYTGTDETICSNIKPYDDSGINIDNRYKCKIEKGNCTKIPKECKDAGSNRVLCSSINLLIQNNGIKFCSFEKNNCVGYYKSGSKLQCYQLDIDSYADLCISFNPKCYYSNGICKKMEKTCSDVIFYSEREENEQICKLLKTTNIDKICSFKKDKTGCEEIYNYNKNEEEEENNKNNPNENDNSSILEIKRILIGVIMVSLLF